MQSLLLENEINTLSKLKSPHLLEFFGAFESSNNVYIITEFCNQGNLAKYIKKAGRIHE